MSAKKEPKTGLRSELEIRWSIRTPSGENVTRATTTFLTTPCEDRPEDIARALSQDLRDFSFLVAEEIRGDFDAPKDASATGSDDRHLLRTLDKLESQLSVLRVQIAELHEEINAIQKSAKTEAAND